MIHFLISMFIKTELDNVEYNFQVIWHKKSLLDNIKEQ